MLCFMGIVTTLAERDRLVISTIHPCISFTNSTFQLHTISLCFLPIPLCIVPTSGVCWASLFIMPNHFSLIPSLHRRWWAWQVDPKLIAHYLVGKVQSPEFWKFTDMDTDIGCVQTCIIFLQRHQWFFVLLQ